MNRRATAEECRIEDVVKMIGGKWKLLILRHLIYGGTTRFNQLHRAIDGITQTMLTKQLRELERDGLYQLALIKTHGPIVCVRWR